MAETLSMKCKRVAVRIALDGGKRLIGSGTILACEQHNHALIFTAAHVLDFVDKKTQPRIHFCFSDKSDTQKLLELKIKRSTSADELPNNSTGLLYIHPKYDRDARNYPRFDAAIVRIMYCNWMDGLPKFNICEPEGEDGFLVGFDHGDDTKIDSPSDFEFATFRGNIFEQKIRLINQRNYNLVVHLKEQHDVYMHRQYNRSIEGLSGAGIISEKSIGLMYHGAFVADKNPARNSHYATSSLAFIEIIKSYRLGISFVDNLKYILKASYKPFNTGADELVFNWYKCKAEKYLEKLQANRFFDDKFVHSEFLSCNSYRPQCPYYFISKLFGSVLMGSIYNISPDMIDKQTIRVDNFDGEIHLQYICSENSIEEIVAETLDSEAFSVGGLFCNGSIFVVTNNAEVKPNQIFSRDRSRRVIRDIVENHNSEWRDDPDFIRNVEELLSENNRHDHYIAFSTVKGDLVQADVGFVGIGRLEEIMKESDGDEKQLITDVERLINNIWKEKTAYVPGK